MKHFFPTPSRSSVYVFSSAPPSLISLSHMVNRVLLTLSWYESLSWNCSNIYWTPRTSFICSKRSEITEETGDSFLPNHRETRNFMNLFEINFVWILIAQRVISINKTFLCNQNISRFLDFTQGRNLSEHGTTAVRRLPESIKLIRILPEFCVRFLLNCRIVTKTKLWKTFKLSCK